MDKIRSRTKSVMMIAIVVFFGQCACYAMPYDASHLRPVSFDERNGRIDRIERAMVILGTFAEYRHEILGSSIFLKGFAFLPSGLKKLDVKLVESRAEVPSSMLIENAEQAEKVISHCERLARELVSWNQDEKNDLGSIVAALKFHDTDAENPPKEEDVRSAALLVKSVKDAIKRMEALQVFIEKGTKFQEAREDIINIGSILEEIKEMIWQATSETEQNTESANVQLALPAGGFPTVIGNKALLKSAFFNLARNALQAGCKNLTINLEYSAHAGNISISIADDGSGIPEDELPRIFDRHFTTKEEGTGLGLVIVKDVIGKHGGTISVTSETSPEKHGTTFIIKLPVVAQVPPRAAAQSLKGAGLSASEKAALGDI